MDGDRRGHSHFVRYEWPDRVRLVTPGRTCVPRRSPGRTEGPVGVSESGLRSLSREGGMPFDRGRLVTNFLKGLGREMEGVLECQRNSVINRRVRL